MKFTLPLIAAAVSVLAGCSSRYDIPELPDSLMSPAEVELAERASSIRVERAELGVLSKYNPYARGHKDFSQTVYFGTGKSALSDEDKLSLRELVNRSEGYSDYMFVVSGHTDRHGSDALNERLSKERSKAVVDELLYLSVPYGKIVVEEKANREPHVIGVTSYGDRKNRRAEIELIFVPDWEE